MTDFGRIIIFEFKHTLKRPLIWIGIIIVILYLLFEFRLYYTDQFPLITEKEYDRQISKLEKHEPGYGLEMLIPISEEEKFISMVVEYSEFLSSNYNIDVKETAEHIINNQLSIEEINEYVKAKIGKTNKPIILLDKKSIGQFGGSLSVGSYDEYIQYLDNILNQENYTEHMGKKALDMGGVVFIFYCCVVFPMIFDADMKRNMYEILHSKKIKAYSYVLGKSLGFGAVIILMGFFCFSVLNIVTCMHCRKLGLDFNVFTFYKYYFAWLVPSILFVESIIIAVTIILRSGIPAIPFIIMYLIKGTDSTTDSDGLIIIAQNYWNILVRLSNNNENLLQILPKSFYYDVLINKIFQTVIIIVLIIISIFVYNKKFIKSRN